MKIRIDRIIKSKIEENKLSESWQINRFNSR